MKTIFYFFFFEVLCFPDKKYQITNCIACCLLNIIYYYCRGNISSANEIFPHRPESERKLLIKRGKVSYFIKTGKTHRFIKKVLSEQSVLLD